MKKYFKTVLLFMISATAIIIFSGCQSSVRFSSSVKQSPYKQRIIEEPKKSVSAQEKPARDSSLSEIKKSKPKIKAPAARREDILAEACSWLGTPYRWGGNSKEGTDCSGFVHSIYKSFGVKMPRTASGQYDFVQKIDSCDAREGDLLFFKSGDKVSHVGIYSGANKMIHASTRNGVIEQDLYLYNYFVKDEHFVGFGRIIDN